MTITMNLIAMLLSFAMMLTGAGGEGQPAQARNLVLHNVQFSYNGESVKLPQALHVGASTDGEKAVFDFGIDQGGETLLPVQLGVSEAGVAALFTKSDVAVNVTADAIDAAMEQASGMMQSMTGAIQTENPELLQFLTEEFLPAYTGLIEAAKDPDFAERMNAKGDEILAGIVDKGEGVADTLLLEGEQYAVTKYTYTLDSDQMAQLMDGIFAAEDALKNYADALFKLYSMLPEESGLNGIASYNDLFNKTGMQASMDFVEQVTADGEINQTNAVLTMDMNAMIKKTVEQQTAEGQETAEVPELPPMVVDIESLKMGAMTDVMTSFDYAVEGVGVNMVAHANDDVDGKLMDMSMGMKQGDETIATMDFSAYMNEEGFNSVNFHIDAPASNTEVAIGAAGTANEDGTGTTNVELSVDSGSDSFNLSFDLDVTADAIEDLVNGHETVLTLDDLSEDALNAIGEDETFQAAMMQVVGSMSMDAQKLTAEENVQKLIALFQFQNDAPVVVDGQPEADGGDYDYTFEIEPEGDYEYEIEGVDGEEDEYDNEEVEDDGELGFEQPQFTWLPEGWEIQETNVDTAYDWMDVTMGDENGENNAYAIFFSDTDNTQVSYLVGDDGSIAPVEGREMSVSDFGEGSVSVTLHEGGLYCNIMFNSADLDLETIGQIVAGIQY